MVQNHKLFLSWKFSDLTIFKKGKWKAKGMDTGVMPLKGKDFSCISNILLLESVSVASRNNFTCEPST